MNLESPIHELKGVGEKTELLFHRAGVRTIRDLLLFFPRTYDLYTQPVPLSQAPVGKKCTVTGLIAGRAQVGGNARLSVTTLHVRDGSVVLKAVWFRMPYLRGTFSSGGMITLRGVIKENRSGLFMEQPEIFYPPSSYDKKLESLQPVYSLVSGLSNNAVQKAVRQAIPFITKELDFIPEQISSRLGLLPVSESFTAMHFPSTKEVYADGRKRFAFQEFFLFILSLSLLRSRTAASENTHVILPDKRVDRLCASLPFSLTQAQRRVWSVIRNDMRRAHPMARLVQGDVGCGKTIIAFLALLDCAFNGYQGALMAPTEVLARQHFSNLSSLCQQYAPDIRIVLLTGSMPAREKKEALFALADNRAHIAVGTHALFQDKVCFHDLGLVVTDEQHRFGVRQRESLAGKGENTHVLVMSATPIPRSMAIILYGDLDLSVIDELPKNRLPIKNCVADTSYRPAAYRFIEEELDKGHQCYVICPVIEDSESSEAQSVTSYAEMLNDVYGGRRRISVLHGKMSPEEKDRIMNDFAEKKTDILVSTTVIEVGIDVPNATVILIENAENFGLAQLHQLRGRVGRGGDQSYCIFISGSKNEETMERLNILKNSNDGFFIANEDLKMRGPGDLFGIRQSGDFNFKIGDIYQDAVLLSAASECAREILSDDCDLSKPEHKRLKKQIDRFTDKTDLGNTL